MIRDRFTNFCWKWVVPGLLSGVIVHDAINLFTQAFQGHRLTSIIISGSILSLYTQVRRGQLHYSWFLPTTTLVGLGATVLLSIGVLTRPWHDPINLLALSLLLGCLIAFTPRTESEKAEEAAIRKAEEDAVQAEVLSEFTDLVNEYGPESAEVRDHVALYAQDEETSKLFQTVLHLVGSRKNPAQG